MKLFVAKLNRDVQDEHLEEAFAAFGPVGYARVITDRDTGQSKCFGFVQMREAEDGRKALEELNGAELMGFRMVVKEAEDRAKKPSDGNARSSRPPVGAQHHHLRVRGQRVLHLERAHLLSIADWNLRQFLRRQVRPKTNQQKLVNSRVARIFMQMGQSQRN